MNRVQADLSDMLKERILTDPFTKNVVDHLICTCADGMSTGEGIDYLVTHHLEKFSTVLFGVYFGLYDSTFKMLCDAMKNRTSFEIEVSADGSDGVRLI